MLKDRILSTFTFFSLLELPLTLLELERYLLPEGSVLRGMLNEQWEITESDQSEQLRIPIGEILHCLEHECSQEIFSKNGFYFLKGQDFLAENRWQNYSFGFKREQLITRYAPLLRHLPFVRGVALSGSQAMGLQKAGSDIDLLVITDSRYLWLARTLITGYFQLFGIRRHGNHVSNRFCLNHYLASPKELAEYKNSYTAFEYLKLRPLVYGYMIQRFQKFNSGWMLRLFPNAAIIPEGFVSVSRFQKALEYCIDATFGRWLELKLKKIQLPKIRSAEKFIVASEDELSFHPGSKQQGVLQSFFNEKLGG